MDSDRFNGASTELIKVFVTLFMMPVVRNIKPKYRYNMEELGMNGLVLGQAEKKSTLLKRPGSRSCITILECISAEGKSYLPE
jgi:hypothetical protein